jgi:hypothetical protein
VERLSITIYLPAPKAWEENFLDVNFEDGPGGRAFNR